MVTQQAQIKLNLPLALRDFLESRAQKFGMPVAAYLKHLILKDVEEMEYPTFKLSKRSEKALKDALKNRDKAITITDMTELDEYFKNL